MEKYNEKNITFLLAKFGQKEHLEMLQSGHLYLNNLRYFNELELNTNLVGIGDKRDGKFYQENATIQAYNPSTNELIFTGTANFEFDNSYKNCPIFCMYGINSENIVKVDKNNKDYDVLHCEISNERKEKIKSNFGEYVLVFKNPQHFIELVKNYLEKHKINNKWESVKYYKPKELTEDRLNALKQGINIVFYKNEELFDYQQEFRLVLDYDNPQNVFEFDIGDISDETILMTKEKFLEIKYDIIVKKIDSIKI